MEKGYLALVLHAHLPYVHHPEYENMFEERWLFEAISESYIPLLDVFRKLIDEGIKFNITLSITPTLLNMLADPLLQSRYINYLEKNIKLASDEIERTKNNHEFNNLALMYYNKYNNDLKTYKNVYNCDIIKPLKELQQLGYIEILACAATHAYLPLLEINTQAVKAQISLGVKEYERFFGCRPRGLWLPECGFCASLESLLKENNIEYIITESHGILYANPRPVYGTYAPIVTPEGIVAFGRDIDSSRQVWSRSEGYPGDFDYRDFYKDIGYELDYSYLKDYFPSSWQRTFTGIKYHKITGFTGNKLPYNPQKACIKAQIHAEDFLSKREEQIINMHKQMDTPPIIVCPYDAELFGHWWYEGPLWIYSLFKNINKYCIKSSTLSQYITKYPIMQVASPCASSWGSNGYNEVWLNKTNDWIYRYLHSAADRMVELANRNSNIENVKNTENTENTENCNPDTDKLKQRALNQEARELLLAQSSDWAFIMKAGTMSEYAEMRTKTHINNFNKLYRDICENNIDETWLSEIEHRNNIFPEIDYRIYCK